MERSLSNDIIKGYFEFTYGFIRLFLIGAVIFIISAWLKVGKLEARCRN